MSTLVKLTLERMVRSFCAAFLSFLAVGINNAQLTEPGLKALVVGGIAAGISACLSLVSTVFGPDPSSTSFTNTVVSTPEGKGQ
jgi:hypothetical protein